MVHAILVLALTAGAIALALAVCNLAATPRLSQVEPAAAEGPLVSIVIPARNEQREIAAAVRSQLDQGYLDFEVVVVEDRSIDATARVLSGLAAGNRRLRVVTGEEPPAGWLGKPHALAQGARAAKGAFLLFVDADVLYDSRCLAEMVTLLETRGADLLAVLPRFASEGFWENVLMPFVLEAYFLGPGFLANRDRPRWLAVGGGAGNLIRREVYDAVGGHEALRDSVIDDVHLALNVKRAGFRARAARAEDRVRVRMYRGFREVCDGFTKNLAYAFNGALGALLLAATALNLLVGVAPIAILAAALLGTEVPRSDLALAVAAYGLPVLARLLMARTLAGPLWPAWTHPISAAVWTGIICRSFYYRFIRRRLTWRGREFDARAARF